MKKNDLKSVIDELEIYTAGRPLKNNVEISVQQLQKCINKLTSIYISNLREQKMDVNSRPERSNFLLMKELMNTFHPEKSGFCTGEEVSFVKSALCLEDRDLLSLQNLRDFVVLYLSSLEEKNPDRRMEIMDIMSAITSIIDTEKLKKGGEV